MIVERLLGRLRVGDDALAQRGDVAANRGQRRPQLVRDGHQEVALELLGLGEPRRHLPEALGEVADLTAAAHRRDVHVTRPSATWSIAFESASTGFVIRRER